MNYYSAVRSLSKMDSKENISCSKFENVATLYKFFFDRSNGEVKILTDNLSDKIFCRSDVLESLEKAIHRGVSFKIIIKNKPSENNEFLNVLAKHQEWRPHSLKVYNAFESSKANKVSSVEFTFCVVDDSSYRWSFREGEGVASMRQPKTAKKINENFEIIVDVLEGRKIEAVKFS